MVFAIPEPATAKLVGVNVRSEHHGDELITAVDLRLRVMLPNTVLDDFAPGLRAAFFSADPATVQKDEAGQGMLSLPISDAPNLRFPQVAGALKWDEELPQCQVHIQAKGHSVQLEQMHVGRFELTPHEGGSVLVSLTARSLHYPGEQAMGHLCAIVAHDVRLAIRPNAPNI